MSLTIKVLLGLLAGFAAGLALAASGSPALLRISALIEPIGVLWTNAIRMTVIPLVISLLISGVLDVPDTKLIGRIGARAAILCVTMVFVAATYSTLLAPTLFQILPFDLSATSQLKNIAQPAATTAVPSATQFVTDLIPSNPVQAAANGAMLPLIVFTLLFAIAAANSAPPQRDSIARGARAIADVTLTLVRWILALAPIGVFALSVGLAAKLGLSALGAVAYYIAAVVILFSIAIAALYLAARLFSSFSMREFGSAAAPAQAVAFSARSSLAALPALVEGAKDKLRAPTEITGFFLPLAASVFRTGSGIAIPLGVVFVAKLYGVTLGPAQLISIIATSTLLAFSVPGIPGGSILIMAPVLMSAGVPVEGLGILLGVDTIPDMFRTTTNVTGDMTAAAILTNSRGRKRAA